MRLLCLLLAIFVVAGCQTTAGVGPGQVSCQPVGMDAAQVAFVFVPGPPSAASAEQTALGMIQACIASRWQDVDPAGLTATVEPGTGDLTGPNKGSDVWLVRVDAKWKDAIVERLAGGPIRAWQPILAHVAR